MEPKLWHGALVVAMFAAGCGMAPAATTPAGPAAAAQAPTLVPTAETQKRRTLKLQDLTVCPDGILGTVEN